MSASCRDCRSPSRLSWNKTSFKSRKEGWGSLVWDRQRERSQDSDEASAVPRGRREARGGLEGVRGRESPRLPGGRSRGQGRWLGAHRRDDQPQWQPEARVCLWDSPALGCAGRRWSYSTSKSKMLLCSARCVYRRKRLAPSGAGLRPGVANTDFPAVLVEARTCATRNPDPGNKRDTKPS